MFVNDLKDILIILSLGKFYENAKLYIFKFTYKDSETGLDEEERCRIKWPINSLHVHV